MGILLYYGKQPLACNPHMKRATMVFTPASMPQRIPKKQPLNVAPKSVSWMKMEKKRQTVQPPNPNVTSCSHVIKGAVWCVPCATAFRKRSRELYAIALASPKNDPHLIRLAHSRLADSLKEFSLTPAGIEELQLEYVKLASDGRSEAKHVYDMIKRLAKEASDRNIKAKTDHLTSIARSKALSAAKPNYTLPQKDENGIFSIKDTSIVYTNHALERMALRDITRSMIKSLAAGKHHVKPLGKGKWIVDNDEGITLCGRFQERPTGAIFIVTTVYHVNMISKEEVTTEQEIVSYDGEDLHE